MQADLPPPHFGASRLWFLSLNAALGAAVLAMLADSRSWVLASTLAIALSLVPILHNLRPFWARA